MNFEFDVAKVIDEAPKTAETYHFGTETYYTRCSGDRVMYWSKCIKMWVGSMIHRDGVCPGYPMAKIIRDHNSSLL